MIDFLQNNWKKTYLFQILIMFFFVIYFHFNPLASNVTFEEFQSLGINIIDESIYSKIQEGKTLADMFPIMMELKEKFDMETIPVLMETLPYKAINILLKRLLYFFLFVDIPTQLCLYCYLAVFFSFLFNYKNKSASIRWKDFFKLYTTILSVVLLTGLIVFMPPYLKFLSFRDSILSKTHMVSESLSTGNYFGLLGEVGSIMKQYNILKDSFVFSENLMILLLFVIIYYTLFTFYKTQQEGFCLSGIIESIQTSNKYKKKCLLVSLLFMIALWLIVTTNYIIFTVIYTFVALQLFTSVMYLGFDLHPE